MSEKGVGYEHVNRASSKHFIMSGRVTTASLSTSGNNIEETKGPS